MNVYSMMDTDQAVVFLTIFNSAPHQRGPMSYDEARRVLSRFRDDDQVGEYGGIHWGHNFQGDYLDLDNQQPKIDLELTSLPTGAGPQTRDNTYLNQYFEAQKKLKDEFDVLNPNTFLQQRLEGIEIKKMLVLNVNSTNKGGGIVNTQFISSHADVPAMDCTFWLEEGVDKNGKKVEFLQYTQNITLDFFDVKWPHIDVNTLIRQS